MKRIVLVNFSLTAGGTERYYSELANCFVFDGYNATIILLRKTRIFYKLDKRINIIEPDFNYPISVIRKMVYFLRIIFYLRKNMKLASPSIVFNASFPSFFILSMFGLKFSYLLTIRCDPKNTKLIEGIKIPLSFRRFAYKKYIGIIAQTSYASDILQKQFKSISIIQIPNILSNAIIPEMGRENIIISAGTLKKSKGFDYLIKAFNELKPKNWKLLILGDGNERQYLEDLIDQYNLNDKVNILGYKSNILEYFARSKIFAFTSLTEGYPNVLLEAMATPLACISFDIVAGPRDIIINGENGFLVEPKNIEEYSSKLKLLIDDEELRNRMMAESLKVRKYNSWKILKHKYYDLI